MQETESVYFFTTENGIYSEWGSLVDLWPDLEGPGDIGEIYILVSSYIFFKTGKIILNVVKAVKVHKKIY